MVLWLVNGWDGAGWKALSLDGGIVGVGWWGWYWMVVETSKVWQLWLVDGWRMQAELHKPTFTN